MRLLFLVAITLLCSCREKPRTPRQFIPASAQLILELEAHKISEPLQKFLIEKSRKNNDWKLLSYLDLKLSTLHKMTYILDASSKKDSPLHILELNTDFELEESFHNLQASKINQHEFAFKIIGFESNTIFEFSRKNDTISLIQISPKLIIAGSSKAVVKALQLDPESQIEPTHELIKKIDSQKSLSSALNFAAIAPLSTLPTHPAIKTLRKASGLATLSSENNASITLTLDFDSLESAKQSSVILKSLIAFVSLPASLSQSLDISPNKNKLHLNAKISEADIIQLNREKEQKDLAKKQKRELLKQ